MLFHYLQVITDDLNMSLIVNRKRHIIKNQMLRSLILLPHTLAEPKLLILVSHMIYFCTIRVLKRLQLKHLFEKLLFVQIYLFFQLLILAKVAFTREVEHDLRLFKVFGFDCLGFVANLIHCFNFVQNFIFVYFLFVMAFDAPVVLKFKKITLLLILLQIFEYVEITGVGHIFDIFN